MENSDVFSRVLSAARWGTFQRMGAAMAHDVGAATLYARNMAVCAELLSYLHICEVATRNAVADALCLRYGPRGLGTRHCYEAFQKHEALHVRTASFSCWADAIAALTSWSRTCALRSGNRCSPEGSMTHYGIRA